MANVSSVTKHFITGQEGFTTTLASTISSGATTVPLNSVSGYTNGDQVAFVIEPTDDDKKQVFTGTIDTSGVQVTGVVWTEGTNQTHNAGVTVVDYWTATHQAAMVKGTLVEHEPTGGHKAAMTVGGVTIGKNAHYAPQGFMQNGVITPSVASNNLTVAIKTLAGTDPSATDPVYVRIGNTVRSITSALSVTKNAGTNWFDAGAAETAAAVIDYFVYLGYNATDGVVIGFARIPYGRLYSSFSATTTSDTYCAISTITNAVSTDEYENVGRFSATLSASASFNWSIAANLVINRPVFQTRPLLYTPTLSNMAIGTGGSASNTARYIINDRKLMVTGNVTLGSSGASVSGGIGISLPLTMNANITTQHIIGNMTGYDTSASTHYPGIVMRSTTTQINPLWLNAGGTYTAWAISSSTVPYTWAAGDWVDWEATYEI